MNSVYLSTFNSSGSEFVGGSNYAWLLSDGRFIESMRNNMLWLAVVPATATAFGLLAAALTDRIAWATLPKP